MPLERDQALALVHLELESRETYALMESANHLSRGQFGSKGERHFHIGLNVEPCPRDCLFCSLIRKAADCPSQALRKKKVKTVDSSCMSSAEYKRTAAPTGLPRS